MVLVVLGGGGVIIHPHSQNLPTASKLHLTPNAGSPFNSVSYSTIKHCAALQTGAVFSPEHYTRPHLVNMKGSVWKKETKKDQDSCVIHSSECPVVSSLTSSSTHFPFKCWFLTWEQIFHQIRTNCTAWIMSIIPICSCPRHLINQGVLSNIPVQYISIFLPPLRSSSQACPCRPGSSL